MLIRHFYHHTYFSHRDLEEVWHPATDIYQTGDKLTVIVELPGCEVKDLRAAVHGTRLVVWGVKKNICPTRPEAFHQLEIHYGRFQRTIPLPSAVDAGKIKAKYENGVLLMEFIMSGVQREKMIIHIA